MNTATDWDVATRPLVSRLAGRRAATRSATTLRRTHVWPCQVLTRLRNSSLPLDKGIDKPFRVRNQPFLSIPTGSIDRHWLGAGLGGPPKCQTQRCETKSGSRVHER